MNSCELLVANAITDVGWTQSQAIPTLCLLVLQSSPDNQALDELVDRCLTIGAVTFATYGDHAQDLEDRIDERLERDERLLPITTTAHVDESPEDVLNFLVRGSRVTDGRLRLLLVFDDGFPDKDRWQREAMRLCSDMLST
jgi:hypothetical protein